jgi:hypothetical protein
MKPCREDLTQLSTVDFRSYACSFAAKQLLTYVMPLQEVFARLIVQSQQAFFQAQTKNALQSRASNIDMFTVVNAEAQYKRKLKQTIREINDEMPRIAELRQSLGDVRTPFPLFAFQARRIRS